MSWIIRNHLMSKPEKAIACIEADGHRFDMINRELAQGADDANKNKRQYSEPEKASRGRGSQGCLFLPPNH